MPQAARAAAARPSASVVEKDQATKAQEQEFKRARGAISCAECRRLKLKCDKTVPCSSCKRRGCASICPNGSLTTGQGTRFILADTDRLHRKITEMSDRIRHLEDALAILQSSTTREAHPLLRPDLLAIKSGLELHSASNAASGTWDSQDGHSLDTNENSIDHFGTLAVQDDGAARYYGWSAGTESLLLGEKETSVKNEVDALPGHIQELSRTFPAATLQLDAGETMQSLIEDYLPDWPRAEELARLYLEQAPWFFGAIKRRQLIEELLPMFYTEAQTGTPQSVETPSSQGASPAGLATSASAFALAASQSVNDTGTAHDLALLFVVFCFGALTDPNLHPAPFNKEASTYYELTRAALNLEPVLERAPSVATVQTLSLMGIYQGLVAGDNSIESTWALMGLSCKLAQSIGLHRDCARWKLPPAEVQKRRALFWELFITDCWQGLATGRLPSFSLPFVDCELPADPDETIADDGSTVPSFPAWKALWGKECVSGVVEITLQSKAPKYSLILELDRKIRDLDIPKYARGEPPRGASLSETMRHFMPINYRELTLLYVHRTFFAQALKDHPMDPLRSQYAPSFLAGYRAACALISTVREQFNINPVQISRFWVLWTHAFSSAVMLGSVVTHGGVTKTAQAALGEVRLAYDLFEKAARYGGRAVKFLPIVRRIHDKAYRAFSQGYQVHRKDIFVPRDQQNEEDANDELSIFSGRTRTVATKAAPKSQNTSSINRRRSVSRMRPGQGADVESSPSGSDPSRSSLSPPAQGSPDTAPTSAVGPSPHVLEAYGSAVHPMLVDQMRTFEGELDTQIYNAQRAFYAENASPSEAAPMNTGYYPAPTDPQLSSMYPQYEQPQDPQWIWSTESMPPAAAPAQEQQSLAYHAQDYHSPQKSLSPTHPAPLQHAPPHQSPAAEQAYSVPMWGAVEAGSHHPNSQSPVEHVYNPSGPSPAPAPALIMSSMPPADPVYMGEQQQHQQQHADQWHQPPYPDQHHHQQYQMYYNPPSQPQPQHQPQHHEQPTPTHSRPHSMHGYAARYHQDPRVESLHTGQNGYNLQDSWNTFFQHELPAPPGGPPAGRR